MKKCAFLAVLLAFSTVALAVPKIDVKVSPPCPDKDDCVYLEICGCAPGYYHVCDMELEACCGEQYLILNVYMDKGCGPCIDQPFQACYTLGKMCPGMYTVVTALWLKDYGCCGWETAALDSTFFTVKGPCCGLSAPMWWPF